MGFPRQLPFHSRPGPMSNATRTTPRRSTLRSVLVSAVAGSLALGLALGAAASADAGQTGQIKGKVTGFEKLLPEVYADSADAKNHRYNWRELSPTVPGQFRALSASPSRDVCIAAIGGNNSPPFETPVLVKVSGGRATPSMLVVSPNTRFAFRNVDPFPHRLFQVNDPKFAAAVTGPGAQREWAAPGNGRYEIRDELFPSLRIFVVVEPTVVKMVNPARSGEFTFEGLAPGDYTLRAYFGGKPTGKDLSGLHVTEKGNTVEIKDIWNVAAESK